MFKKGVIYFTFIILALFITKSEVFATSVKTALPIKEVSFEKSTLDSPSSLGVTLILEKNTDCDYISFNFENEKGIKLSFSPFMMEETLVKLADGSLKIIEKIDISKYQAPGIYKPKSIDMQLSSDNRGTVNYKGKAIEPFNISFTVNNKNGYDVIPPKITDIQIDKVTLKELQKSTISVTISDENSGVSRVNAGLTLVNENGDRIVVTLYSVDRNWDTVVKTNVFEGEVAITNNSSGIYHIAEMNVYDNADNEAAFIYDHAKKSLVSKEQLFLFSKEISVSNKFDKLNLFELKDSGKNFTQPTVFSFSAIADKELAKSDSLYKDAEFFIICRHEGSYNSYWIPLYNKYWDEASNTYKPLVENNYKSSSEINKYMPNGVYYADNIFVRTKDGEEYFRAPDFYFTVNFAQNTTAIYNDKNTLNQVLKTNNSTPMFFYGSVDIPKEFIEQIKKQKRTLIFDTDDVQIVLQTKDIISPVKVNVDNIFDTSNNFNEYKSWSPNPVDIKTADSIIKLLNNKNVALLMFKENAELPGNSIIRCRLSYDVREAIGTKKLYVYEYDKTKNKLNLIKSDVDLDVDGYIEIPSKLLNNYVVTNKKL